MKLGIAGSGKIVHEFLSHADGIQDLSIDAVWGREKSIGKLCLLADEYKIGEVYTDYDRMLSSDIDTVYVALPNHLHYAYAKRALEAGKNVILEKPFTLTRESGEALFDAAEKAKVYLYEAITNQYAPDYEKIHRLLPKLGNIRMVQGNYSQYSSRYDNFRNGKMLPAFDPAAGGGALGDINIYNIHMTVGLFGEPEETMYYPNIQKGSDTSGVLLLRYPEFTAVLTGAKDSESEPFYIIQGEDGDIHQRTTPGTCGAFDITLRDGWNQRYDLAGDTFRMLHEWRVFASEGTRNFPLYHRMKDHTLTVLSVVDAARASCGILPADEPDPFEV